MRDVVSSLDFSEFYRGKFNATFKHQGLVLSVSYGEGLYGSGPGENSDGTYEIAMWRDGCDGWIKLSDHDDVAGWQTDEQVNSLIDDMKNGKFDDA